MSDEKIATSEALPLPSPEICTVLRTAVEQLGSQSGLARASGVPQGSISHMLNGSRPIYAEAAVAFERATAGRVTRGQLRPDLWPESASSTEAQIGIPVGRHYTTVDRQQEAFEAYRDAFNQNAWKPTLAHARALVEAWDAYAVAMDLGPLDTELTQRKRRQFSDDFNVPDDGPF